MHAPCDYRSLPPLPSAPNSLKTPPFPFRLPFASKSLMTPPPVAFHLTFAANSSLTPPPAPFRLSLAANSLCAPPFSSRLSCCQLRIHLPTNQRNQQPTKLYPTGKSTNLPAHQPINQPTNKPRNACYGPNQTTNLSENQPTHPQTNRRTVEPRNNNYCGPTNQSTFQEPCLWHRCSLRRPPRPRTTLPPPPPPRPATTATATSTTTLTRRGCAWAMRRRPEHPPP